MHQVSPKVHIPNRWSNQSADPRSPGKYPLTRAFRLPVCLILYTFCDAVGVDTKSADACESSYGACQTEMAAGVKSSGFNSDNLTALKSAPITHGKARHSASSIIQPSVKTKHRRPLSGRRGQRLIVKGFAFYQKCKRVQSSASNCVTVEKDGYSAEASVSSETVMSPNKVIEESTGIGATNDIRTVVVKKHDLPQETLADGSLFNDEHVSLRRKCGQEKEYEYGSDDKVRMTVGNAKGKDGCSGDASAVNARKRGRLRKMHVASVSLTDSDNNRLMRNCGSNGSRVKAAVVHRRGRPRKRPFACAPVSATDMIVNGGVSVIRQRHLQDSWNANAIVVRRRGRPHEIPIDNVSLVDKNALRATKRVQQEEHQDDNGREARKTDGLVNAGEMARTSCDSNTAVQKRGRPRKSHEGDTSQNDLNVSIRGKRSRQGEYQGASYVQKRVIS